MQKITCLTDAINHVPRVRVIKEGNKFHGEEFDIVIHNYEDKEVTIIGSHEYDYIRYQYSEIQFLTPVQYEGRYIGFGDKVNGKEVFHYEWEDKGWVINCASGYDDIHYYYERDIKSFTPLHKLTPKIELSNEELIEELKRRGVVTQGNVIKN